MSSKFAGLAVNVGAPSRMVIINPMTDKPLADKNGKEAYIDLLSADNPEASKIDRAQTLAFKQQMRSGRFRDDDPIEEQVAKLQALTAGWYLVDLDGNPIDVPFSADAAKELYAAHEMAWLRRQAWVYVNDVANFTKRSSTT